MSFRVRPGLAASLRYARRHEAPFDSLEALLAELRDQQVKVVRISPAVEQEASTEPGGIPSLTSRVIATAVLDERLWAEWRYRVGRGLADVVERGVVLPEWLRRRSEEALAIIAQYVDHQGFEIREGIVAHDTAAIDTFRLPVEAPSSPRAARPLVVVPSAGDEHALT